MLSNKKKSLGEMLIEERLISSQILEKALALQKQEYQPLGIILLKINAISVDDLERILTSQCGFIYLNPKFYKLIDKSLLQIIPADLAKKYHCFPLEKIKNSLKIAIVDPLDTDALVELTSSTKMTIHLVTSRQVWIDELINIYYTGKM